MKIELQAGFEDMPVWRDGRLLMVANTEAEYEFYLKWLADYLYRPGPGTETITEEDAMTRVIGVECEAAWWMWEHPFEDYPFPQGQHPELPGHADICHRRELSEILSRVPDKRTRISLLDRFYRELDRDSKK